MLQNVKNIYNIIQLKSYAIEFISMIL